MSEPSNHNYNVTIKLSKEVETNTSATPGNPEKTIASPSKTNIIKMLGQSTAVQTGKNFVTQAVSFTVSNVGLVTGNSASQDRINFALNTTKFAVNTAMVLSTGNPAVMISYALTTAMGVYFNQRQIDLNYGIERESLNLSRQRAGIAFNRSRLTGST